MHRGMGLLLFTFASTVWAAKVVSVTPENELTTLVKFAHYGQVYYHWVINDLVCLARPMKNPIVCGRVAQYDKVSTLIRVAKTSTPFSPGDEVKILYTKTKRDVAGTSMGHVSTPRSSALASVGFGAGLTYLLFQGQFQLALAKKFTLGLTVPFAKSSGDRSNVSALGLLLSANYYLVNRFAGYNFEVGAGTYLLSQEVLANPAENSSSKPLAVYSTFGWKGRINRGLFSLGINGGIQFVGDHSDLPDFKGVMPLFAFSFGVNF